MKKLRPQSMKEAGPSFWITKAAADRLRSLMDPAATCVYVALCRLHNDRGGKDWFAASFAGIADTAGISVRSAVYKVKLLQDKGFILRKKTPSEVGRTNECNQYAITHFLHKGYAPQTQPSAADAQGYANENRVSLHRNKNPLRASLERSSKEQGDEKEIPLSASDGRALGAPASERSEDNHNQTESVLTWD